MSITETEENYYSALVTKFLSADKDIAIADDPSNLPSIDEFAKIVEREYPTRGAELIVIFIGKKPKEAIRILLDNPELREEIHKKGLYTFRHIIPVYLEHPEGRALLSKEFLQSLPESAVYGIAETIRNAAKLPAFLAENKDFTIALANSRGYRPGNSYTKFAASEIGCVLGENPALKDFLLSSEFLESLNAIAAGEFFAEFAYNANYDPTRSIGYDGRPAFSNPESVKPSVTKEEYQRVRDFLLNKFPAQTAFTALKHEVLNTPEYFHDKDKGPLAFINTPEFLARIDKETAVDLFKKLNDSMPDRSSVYPHVFRDFLARNLPFTLRLKKHSQHSQYGNLADNFRVQLANLDDIKRIQSLITPDNALQVLELIVRSEGMGVPIQINQELRDALLDADKSSEMFFEIADLCQRYPLVVSSEDFLSRITPRVADELTANPAQDISSYADLFTNEKFVEKIFSEASSPERLLVKAISELFRENGISMIGMMNSPAIKNLDLSKVFDTNGVDKPEVYKDKAIEALKISVFCHYIEWKLAQETFVGRLQNTKPHFDFLDKIPSSEEKKRVVSGFVELNSNEVLSNPELYKGLQIAYSGKNIAETLKAEALAARTPPMI